MTEAWISKFGDTTYIKIDLAENIPLPHSYSVDDLLSMDGGPGERMGGGSKTMKLPGSKNNLKQFGHIFDINISDCTFNVNKRCRIRIEQDTLPVMNGVLKLDMIERFNDEIWLNCT